MVCAPMLRHAIHEGGFTVKLIRLLVPLVMLVVGLSAPAPAAAAAPADLSPEALRGVCTTFGGIYREDDPLAPVCEFSDDGAILCEIRDQRASVCQYYPIVEYSLPPLSKTCELVAGAFIVRQDIGRTSCQVHGVVLISECPSPLPLSETVACKPMVADSDQPMSRGNP